MIRSLVYGFIIFCAIVLGAVLIGDMQVAMSFAGGLGLVCLFAAPILSRVFANGHHVNIKLANETQQYRRLRLQWVGRTISFAAPNIIGAMIVFFIHF
ncbi:hypothetical protein GCM10011391_33890 [Pullulanibacillus camelliae]|uniref:Uncharacterized protein n=1 Tax=Pullulanibacillus camelliae TaxID=1707096 RepID=A0A8J2YLK9_9BACL|nr:DUF5316 family protein [Pullulanibacillus camelliae]GGE52280.1 hypothetical protein GCM10011391_33890 [Pullulanibacillus camelliae]